MKLNIFGYFHNMHEVEGVIGKLCMALRRGISITKLPHGIRLNFTYQAFTESWVALYHCTVTHVHEAHTEITEHLNKNLVLRN
jgi:hypothetical protein